MPAWHTFTGSPLSDFGSDISVDENGTVYLIGTSEDTWGDPVNPYAGGDDAFVAKFENNGNLQWHTFLGSAGDDTGRDIAVHNSGNSYVVGDSNEAWGSP